MQFSLRALFLAILSVSISALWASNSQAEYWSHPFIGKCRDSGFACARKVSIAVYGADQTFSRCNYIRADYYGYLVMAECKGSRGWGMVNLNCESGEVKSTNGCISAPIVDKDPPCESQAGNPVDASSGMKLEYVLDFTTAGPLPLKFERHYRSETNTRDGEYAQVLDYDSSGNNTSVTDSFGRSLTFTYSSKGLLQTMRTPDGMTYAYGYAIRYFEDYAPYLSESSTEAAEFFALKSVTYPSGLSRQYHYENGAYPFALTGITDERGVRYATFAYDDDGRVTRSEHVDGNDAHQFAYDDTALTTTVVNPLGKQSVYHFESDVQSLKRLKRLEGNSIGIASS
jgi:YD repeat-containing protein